MIDERDGVSVIYIGFMTAVILALAILFVLRSRYAVKTLMVLEHQNAC